jgi:hypothetical protein
MMLAGKTKRKRQETSIYLTSHAKPTANLRNLVICGYFHLQGSVRRDAPLSIQTSLFYLRLSASICGLRSSVRSLFAYIRVHSRLICGPAADETFYQSGQVVAITAF